MSERTSTQQGRHNRRVGADAERDLARWLRPWWPDARRAVVQGWNAKTAWAADPGDLEGTSPGLWWSVKACERERVGEWTAEVETKRSGRLGLLVTRRNRHPDPGDWWVWLRQDAYAELLTARTSGLPAAWADPLPGWVRTEMRCLMPLMVTAGYARSPR